MKRYSLTIESEIEGEQVDMKLERTFDVEEIKLIENS
jgi:hypothetical protein